MSDVSILPKLRWHFSRGEFLGRLEKVRHAMAARKIDLLVVSVPRILRGSPARMGTPSITINVSLFLLMTNRCGLEEVLTSRVLKQLFS